MIFHRQHLSSVLSAVIAVSCRDVLPDDEAFGVPDVIECICADHHHIICANKFIF